MQRSSATLGLLEFLFSTARCLWVGVCAVSSKSADEKFLSHSCWGVREVLCRQRKESSPRVCVAGGAQNSLAGCRSLMGCEQPASFHPHGRVLGAGFCDNMYVLASGERGSPKEQGEPQGGG